MKKHLFTFSMEHPRLVMGIVGVLTALALIQFPRMRIDTDPENMLSSNEHVRKFHHQVKETFGLNDMLVLGIFREKGVFTPETVSRVMAITEEIKQLDGVLADDIMALGEVDDITNAESSIRVHPLVENLPQTREDGLALKYAIDRNPILGNKLSSFDGKLVGIYVPIAEKKLSYKLSREMEAIARKHLKEEEFHIAGLPVAEDTFGAEMFRQMGIAAPLAGLVIMALLFFFFRSFSIIAAPMLLAVVTVLWTMGLMIGTGHTVHIMGSMIPIFLFPIAVLNSIHILSSFHERYQKYKHMKTTILHTMEELFAPMLFTSLTTLVGFLSLAMTPIPPVQVFGIFVSFGIASAWLLSMTFLPAYAMLLPKENLKYFGITEEGDDSLLERILPKIREWSTRRARQVAIGTAVLLLLSAVGISRIVINDNPVNWFKASHPLRKADTLMNSHMGGTYMSNLVFGGEPDSFKRPEVIGYMNRIQEFIDGQDGVGATTSVADILGKISYELKGSSALPENYEEIAQYYFIYEMAGGDPDDLFTFITPEYDQAHIWVQMTKGDNLLMSGLVDRVSEYMKNNPLPAGMRAEWAGLNYINVVWQDRMVRGMLWSLLGSFITVLVMMIILFRSFLWGLLSMIPLTVTITFIYALIGFIGKPYDMPVAVLSSLTLGLSIDFAIHFIKRAQFIHSETGDFAETMKRMFGEPAKAITRNTLVIAIGFVPLFLANLVPYITVGVFFFVIMLFSGFATLVIMPALSTLLRNRLFGELVPVHQTRSKHVKDLTRKTATGLLAAALMVTGFSMLSPASATAETAEAIMQKSHLAYYYSGDDGLAEVEMTLADSRGKTRNRKFTMLRRDVSEGGEQKYFIYFREPGDVRRMTFMVWKDPKNNDSRWMFIPSLDLVKRIAANDKRSSFVGSDFTYEDVSGRHWTEDTHSLEREETLDGKSVYVVKSVPRDNKDIDYQYRLTWVDKQTWLPLKEEYYDRKGTVVKTFEAEDIRVIDGIPTITRRIMTNTVKNHKTVVSFSEIKYNLGIKDDTFSERYLRMPPNEYFSAGE